jgi:hypothetical protein
VAVGLILAATLQQVQPPPPTQTSVQQTRVSLNVPPSLLLGALQRHLQSITAMADGKHGGLTAAHSDPPGGAGLPR